MPDFSALLNENLDSVQKPPALPAGQYFATITNYELGDANRNKTPYCRVFLRLDAPGNGVDPADLEGIDLAKRTQRTDYYLTAEAAYRLKELLNSCGVDTNGRSFNETLPELKDCTVMVDMDLRNSQDGTEVYSNVKKIVGTAS